MADSRSRLLPWALLLLVLPVALLAIAATAPAACDELPNAFHRGGTTSDTSGPEAFIVDSCERVEADGAREAVTVVNWTGIAIALVLCLGAWLVGSVLASWGRTKVS